MEGDYRGHHFDILTHSEEIAFYNGGKWETERVNTSLNRLIDHSKMIIEKRFFMGIADSVLVKYGAFVLGYVVVGLPVFGPRRKEYLARINNDSSAIVKDYVRNTGLLINLAKAIGKIIISYKELQNLAGYTTLVTECEKVLEDMKTNTYERSYLNDELAKERGESSVDKNTLSLDKVPIVTPSGELLLKDVSLNLEQGMNCFVKGPNGCGKTSIFRILGGLWPVHGGKMVTPGKDTQFIPQTSYLPAGNLRDQVIYPDTKEDMIKKGKTDDNVRELLRAVQLEGLIDKWGLDTPQPWKDIFSGGQRQRVSIARCFY